MVISIDSKLSYFYRFNSLFVKYARETIALINK